MGSLVVRDSDLLMKCFKKPGVHMCITSPFVADTRICRFTCLLRRTFPFGGERFDSATAATQPSTDDRVSFRGGNGQMNGSLTWLPSSTDGGPGDHDDFAGAMVSSAWLMGGETAREGMIESIATENAGRSGPRVVEDGVFQAGLLRPSEVLISVFV